MIIDLFKKWPEKDYFGLRRLIQIVKDAKKSELTLKATNKE